MYGHLPFASSALVMFELSSLQESNYKIIQYKIVYVYLTIVVCSQFILTLFNYNFSESIIAYRSYKYKERPIVLYPFNLIFK